MVLQNRMQVGSLYRACASTSIHSVLPGLPVCINKTSFVRALASLFFLTEPFHIIFLAFLSGNALTEKITECL